MAVKHDASGDKRLIAWVVYGEQPAPAASELRSYLKRTLPDYMLPAALLPLDELPLTPNGKIDRRALPDADVSTNELAEAFVPPRDVVEQVLAEIWREVLDVPAVGVHDDFFALGGHSLLATQVVSRVREALQTDLPLLALFEAPTVAALAARLQSDSRNSSNEVRTTAEVWLDLMRLSDDQVRAMLAAESRAERP